MKRPSVATFAIGTEITDGQIVNRNSGWIAQRLTEFGFVMCEHRSTPDDRELMLIAMKELCERNDYLFITGGLGPTSDDFTRDVVAEFFGKPLVFDEKSWDQVVARLEKRGVPVRESQRQQCQFPEGAKVLVNSAGTANGFYLEEKGTKVYVLPGPPAEIAAIWNSEIDPILKNLVPKSERERLFLFRCMGKGESEFADITESIFADVAGVRLGYRVHAPYVEVKVWVKEREAELHSAKIAELNQKLEPYLINRDQSDLMQDLLGWATEGRSVRVIDLASSGLFQERILEQVRTSGQAESALPITIAVELRQPSINAGDTQHFASAAGRDEVVLVLAKEAGAERFLVGISAHGNKSEFAYPLPFRLKPESERARKFLVEKALQAFRDTVISPRLS